MNLSSLLQVRHQLQLSILYYLACVNSFTPTKTSLHQPWGSSAKQVRRRKRRLPPPKLPPMPPLPPFPLMPPLPPLPPMPPLPPLPPLPLPLMLHLRQLRPP
jgi:hypothetical protein